MVATTWYTEVLADVAVPAVVVFVGNAGAIAYPWFVGWSLAATAGYAACFAAMGLSADAIWVLWVRSIGH